MVMKILGTLVIAFPLATITTKAIYFLFGAYVSKLPGYDIGFPLLSLAICLPFAWPAWGKIWNLISEGLFEFGDKVYPLIIDTSAIIDGRILSIIQSGLIDKPILIPHTVLDSLRKMADATDGKKREQGRAGLDTVALLKEQASSLTVPRITVPEDGEIDFAITSFAKSTNSKIVTLSKNLEKVAHIEGVITININELAHQLSQGPAPGEINQIKITKKGENPGQGIGYLANGTMIVVENAEKDVDNTIKVEITRNLQTHGGTLYFGKKV